MHVDGGGEGMAALQSEMRAMREDFANIRFRIDVDGRRLGSVVYDVLAEERRMGRARR